MRKSEDPERTPRSASRNGLCCRRAICLPAAALAALTLLSTSAAADLKICNATSSRIGVAIGYQDARGWTTEGWWNVRSQACEPLLKGNLPSRYIYVYAIDYDRGGEWAGKSFMCTSDRSFLIRDAKDCEQRGHKRTGFFEIDTGDGKDWTIRLTETDENVRAR